jgi:hypothetical protein
MASTDHEARQMAETLRRLPEHVRSAVQAVSELGEEDAAVVMRGMREVTPKEIQLLARKLLAEWEALSVEERVASLVALAAALLPSSNR